MHIVCCTDHNYIMPTGIMICSVCENNSNISIIFHVICNNNVSIEDKSDLNNIVNRYNQTINFYKIDNDIPACFTIGKENQPQHITISSYYRLFLADILPSDIEKVLYLDGDIVVRKSLESLYNTDIKDYSIGAVIDMSQSNISYYNRLKYSPSYGYFNAGVLLINLSFWREHNLIKEFIDFASNYPERIKLHDQDILNFVLRNSKYNLPLSYNFQSGFLYKHEYRDFSWEYDEEIEKCYLDPHIIHYTCPIKPWGEKCNFPYKSAFFQYRDLTKWKNQELIKGPKLTWKGKLKRFLITSGFLKDIPQLDLYLPVSLQI